jgi:hypothetical protein
MTSTCILHGERLNNIQQNFNKNWLKGNWNEVSVFKMWYGRTPAETFI